MSDIIDSLGSLDRSAFGGDEKARLQAVWAVRKLLSRLELPAEQARKQSFEHNMVYAVINIFIDLGLWEAWYESGGGNKSLDELVKLAKAEIAPNLLRRLMRIITAVNIIEEVGVDQFKATDFSLWIGDKSTLGAQMLLNNAHHTLDASRNLPAFFKKHGYQEPRDYDHSNYVESNPEGLTIWQRCATNPAYRESWNGGMGVWNRWKTPWVDIYDAERLIVGADYSAGPLLVDIGGNDGNDLARFLAKHPDVPAASLVLQDRPEAIQKFKDRNTNDKITAMAHDFFKEQPIKGSRAYFLHSVIHDWPDKDAITILSSVAQAMKPGYSKLLVADMVIPPTGATVFQATIDLQLMSQHSGGERVQADWEKLLAAAGLKIARIFNDPKGHEGVIEAELA